MSEGKWALQISGWFLYDLVRVEGVPYRAGRYIFTLMAIREVADGCPPIKIRLTANQCVTPSLFRKQLAKHGVEIGKVNEASLDDMMNRWFSPKPPGYKPPPRGERTDAGRHLRAKSKSKSTIEEIVE